MDRYEKIFKEKKQALEEMAYVGTVDGIDIHVYTDHEPEHFHAIKKDEFEARISTDTLEVIGYKWKKQNKELSSSELKNIKKWLNQPSKKYRGVTNYQRIRIFWDGLNPER